MKNKAKKTLLKIFLAIPLVFLESSEVFGETKELSADQVVQSDPEVTKADKACKIALDAIKAGELALLTQYILEHISVISHEYGHAIPSIVNGLPYKIEIISTGNILFPVNGICYSETRFEFLTTLLGPVSGVLSKCIQCLLIKEYSVHGNLKFESYDKTNVITFLIHFLDKAVKSPFEFFDDITQKGKYFGTHILENGTIPFKSSGHFSLLFTDMLLSLRFISIITECIYGFLPYKISGDIPGDGEDLWTQILGHKPPTFSINRKALACGILAGAFFGGIIRAAKEQWDKKKIQ